MNALLTGLRVLVTRPDPQHEEICTAIREAGGSAFHFPLIRVEPITEEHSTQHIKSRIKNLDQYHILIFVSTNAVRYGAHWITQCCEGVPIHADVLAIGLGTARKASCELNCDVTNSGQGGNSERLLESEKLKDIQGKKIAIFRGQGGRELLNDTLRLRGADVDYIEVYKRLPANNTSAKLLKLQKEENINTYFITSAESLQRLNSLLEGSTQKEGALKKIPLIVPSVRVAKMAEHFGFMKVKVAMGVDIEATINALQELAN